MNVIHCDDERVDYYCSFNFWLVAASQRDIECEEKWRTDLERLIAHPVKEPLIIRAFLGPPMTQGASRPIVSRAMDGYNYVLKGRQAGRQIINDQIVGRLGVLLGAPVPPIYIAEVDECLTNDPDEPEYHYFHSGLAHASQLISGCMDDRDIFRYQGQLANRSRFARLSVLYGWVEASDRQFIYKSSSPNIVYSVDHGNFFPGGPNWTTGDLVWSSRAVLDPTIARSCRFQATEIQEALTALAEVSEREILETVARPPAEWGITIDERVSLVAYLVYRRQELLKINIDSSGKEG